MRLAAIVLATLLLAGLAVTILVRLNEHRLIYFPTRDIVATPAAVGLPFEDVTITATDGTRLHGWFVPSAREGPVILFLHGNAGNISYRLEKIAILHDLGAAVFIVDYRGYGRSEGAPSEVGLALDGRAALAHLIETRRVDPARVIAYGESLGTAVATDVVAGTSVGGLVLESGFASARVVASEMSWLPLGLVIATRFDTEARLPRVTAPILILHSRGDEFFGMHHATRLRDAARAPVRLVELQGGHNDAFVVSAGVYRQALLEFLAGLAPRGANVAP